MTAIITSIDDTANAAVIDESVPDIYSASISRGSVNVSPLVFDNAFTAPNSPSALDVHNIIPYISDHFIFGSVILKNIVKPSAPISAAASSSSFPSELSTGIISLDT